MGSRPSRKTRGSCIIQKSESPGALAGATGALDQNIAPNFYAIDAPDATKTLIIARPFHRVIACVAAHLAGGIVESLNARGIA